MWPVKLEQLFCINQNVHLNFFSANFENNSLGRLVKAAVSASFGKRKVVFLEVGCKLPLVR